MGLKFLNAEKKQFFSDHGYLVLNDFKKASDCDALKTRMMSLLDGFNADSHRYTFSTKREEDHNREAYFMDSSDRIHFFFEEEAIDEQGRLIKEKPYAINKVGHGLHDVDETFNHFSRDPRMADICADLDFQEPILIESMYIFKQPHIGGEVRPHQDSTYLYTEPESTVGFWFAIEDATIENGCLWALPGGHKGPLESRYVRGDGNQAKLVRLNDVDWPEDQFVPLEVPKGSLVLLHGLLPHKSEANRAPKSRHAYAVHILEGTHEYPFGNWIRRPGDHPARGF